MTDRISLEAFAARCEQAASSLRTEEDYRFEAETCEVAARHARLLAKIEQFCDTRRPDSDSPEAIGFELALFRVLRLLREDER